MGPFNTSDQFSNTHHLLSVPTLSASALISLLRWAHLPVCIFPTPWSTSLFYFLEPSVNPIERFSSNTPFSNPQDTIPNPHGSPISEISQVIQLLLSLSQKLGITWGRSILEPYAHHTYGLLLAIYATQMCLVFK